MVAGKNKKYVCDDFLFVDENEKSFYLAGFIAADGCLQTEHGKCLSFNLSIKDRNFLYDIKNCFKSNNPINTYDRASKLTIYSDRIFNDLKKFNVVPNKTYTYTFPKWIKDHELKHHFMRGYVDGDGSFYINKQYNYKVAFGLRGTESFLLDFRKVLEIQCGFKTRNNPIPYSGNWPQLGYTGNENIIKIATFLYKDATIFLSRKKEAAFNAFNLLDNKYEQKKKN